jgi:hypothetical protein
MRELYKKFNKVFDLVNKQFTSGAATEAKKKPAPAKKAKVPTKKGKKSDKENKNPTTAKVKAEKSDDEDQDATRNNDDEEDDDDIRASANDQSKMADFTTIENPMLESTTNVAKRGANAKSKKPAPNKFEYTHRISYTCLQKLLDIYFG